MLGYQPDELAPHISAWEPLVHPEDKVQIETELQKHLQGKTPIYGRADARNGWVRNNSLPS
jgi:hypothetical protein